MRTHCERALRNGTDETGVDPERGRKRPVAGAGPPERTPSSPRPPGPAPGRRLAPRLGVCVSPETVSANAPLFSADEKQIFSKSRFGLVWL